MNCKSLKLIVFLMLISLDIVNTANADFFSLISKAGKAIKKADVDVANSKIELPENMGNFSSARIRPNSSGQWEIKSEDGSILSFDDMLKDSNKKNKHILVLESVDIPTDLSMFNNIPMSLPIYIKGKKGRVFELKRERGITLKYKDLQLQVSSSKQLKDGIWHLQRPALTGGIRFFQLDSNINKQLLGKVYGSKTAVEKIAVQALLQSMSLLKRQTIVISSSVKDGRLQGAGRNIPIRALQKAAAENDITLVIIESDNPAKLLKILVSDANTKNGIKDLYNTTGDFLNKFKDPKNPTSLKLSISKTGDIQSLVHLKSGKKRLGYKDSPDINKGLVNMSHIPLHLLSKGMIMYRPSLERSEELSQRIVPWLHSDISFYLIASSILGLTALSTSWMLWNKLWLLPRRKDYYSVLVFSPIWLIHKIFFIMLFIPVFGMLGFIYAFASFVVKICMMVVKLLNMIFINPVRWVFAKAIR